MKKRIAKKIWSGWPQGPEAGIRHWPTGSGPGGCNAICGASAPYGQQLPAITFDRNLKLVLYDVADKHDEVTCEACRAHLPRQDGCLGASVILIDVAPFGKKLPERCPRHRRRLRYTGWSIGGRHYYACSAAKQTKRRGRK